MPISLKNIGGLQSIVSYSPATGSSPAPWTNTKSLDFDGSDAFNPDIPTADFQTILRDNHSISFWVKHSWLQTCDFLGLIDNGNALAPAIRLNFVYYMPGLTFLQFSSKLGGGNSASAFLMNHASTSDADSWVHFCYSQTKAATAATVGSYVLYINGTAAYTGATSAGATQEATIATDNKGFYFGATNNSGIATQANCVSKIDEIAYFNADLSPESVAAIYNLGVAKDIRSDYTSGSNDYDQSSALVRYYRLEDDTTDAQGNNDGVLVGDPTYSTETPS